MKEGIPFCRVPGDVTQTITSYLDSPSALSLRLVDKCRAAALTLASLIALFSSLLASIANDAELEGLLQVPIPQLPLNSDLSHFYTSGITRWLFHQLISRLCILDNCGLSRWRLPLLMLYYIRGRRPLVLEKKNFGVFDSVADALRQPEAKRQWSVMSHCLQLSLSQGGAQPVMEYGRISSPSNIRHHLRIAVRDSPSPLCPDAFDPKDPTTEIDQTDTVFHTYSGMVAFTLAGLSRRPSGRDAIRPRATPGTAVSFLWFARDRSSAIARWVRAVLEYPASALPMRVYDKVLRRGTDRRSVSERGTSIEIRNSRYRLIVVTTSTQHGHFACVTVGDYPSLVSGLAGTCRCSYERA